MSIKYVILGYLNWRPMSGYDVKRIIADSETLPWSANNNQIYRALVQLHDDELVTKEIQEQTGAPNRHIYSITEKGIQALRSWAGGESQLPQTKKPFLNQLMWADCLDAGEMDELLEGYLNMIGEKLFFLRVQAEERPHMPDRTRRERYLWDMINKSWIAHFELELKWIRQVRQDLSHIEAGRHWAVS
jgi:DNA-binding PadR family transcriptional regulator